MARCRRDNRQSQGHLSGHRLCDRRRFAHGAEHEAFDRIPAPKHGGVNWGDRDAEHLRRVGCAGRGLSTGHLHGAFRAEHHEREPDVRGNRNVSNHNRGRFWRHPGASTVKFGVATASPTSWSAGSITAPVPAAATTGNVVVTVGGVSSNGLPFTVTASPTDTQPPSRAGKSDCNCYQRKSDQSNWVTATDNTAVTAYHVEQCVGAGCSNFTEIATVNAGPSVGPLSASANPNYFKDASGTPIILNGSHTWNSLQDWGSNGSLRTLDFPAFVNFLVAHGHNFTFLWCTELPKFCGLPTTDQFAARFHRWSASLAENRSRQCNRWWTSIRSDEV